MKFEKSLWISTHIFYAPEQIDFLLLDGVLPFFVNLNQNKFFFIRYRVNGSHIRLRIKAKNKDERITLIKNQKLYFKNFFKKFPSKRDEPKFVKEGNYYWHPNNSIFYEEYVQEVDRYGGPDSIEIAEDHFESSSIIVLKLLKEEKDIIYQKKLVLAMMLNLSFTIGLGFSKKEAMLFYKFLFKNWLPLSFRTKNAFELDKKVRKEFNVNTLTLFNNKFKSQANILVPKVEKWWNTFNSMEESSNLLLRGWINNTATAQKKLNELLEKGNLDIPDHFQPQLLKHLSQKKIKDYNTDLWFIYQSLVHMSNNRIGLRTRDEPYISHLLYSALEKI